jgi:hypothetical protein
MDKYPLKPKPVVYYRTDVDFFVKMGQGAIVHPVNHPSDLVSNTKAVLTSEVIQFNPINGGFETMNTVYQPYKEAV